MEIVRWRLATAKDVPAIRELHARMQQKAGRKITFPGEDNPAPFVMVGEDGSGAIKVTAFFESVLELGIIADEPQAVRELVKIVPEIAAGCKLRGFNLVRAFVHKQFGRSLGRMLERAGFTRVTDYEHWDRELGGG